MATINPTSIRRNDDAVSVQWAGIAAGDDCEPYVGFSDYSDRSVQVEGTFGGATIDIKGSNDGENFKTLTDPFGSALSLTTGSLKQVLEYVWKMRPEITGGVTTSLTVTIIAKRIRR
jgi:hypothetical protein